MIINLNLLLMITIYVRIHKLSSTIKEKIKL